MDQAYLIFDEKTKKLGGRQKFVLLKTKNNFIFASLPLKQAPQHYNIVDQVEKNKKLKEFSILGGGYLNLYYNVINLETSSFSYKYGPIKISWQKLQKILEDLVGNQYKVKLSDN